MGFHELRRSVPAAGETPVGGHPNPPALRQTPLGRYDLIVVGSGIAGLYAALLAARQGRVLLVSKGALEESNTRYAQGGIAVALAPSDSPELHLRDTVAAGDGLCHAGNVAILTGEAPGCILDLLRRGVPFDREGGELAFTREAAHTLPRVLHAGGDATGAQIERSLVAEVRAAGVTVLEDTLCTELILDEGRVAGVRLLLPEGLLAEARAGFVLLATGGAGQLFSRTTNPAVATGDGLAIAYRAGAELTDLEFMQFHPTALMLEGAPSFLISEAVRGEGGILRNLRGRAFMADYHQDAELAPRDVVARAIHQEMQDTGSRHVWLDITHLEPELIERRFPSIVSFCRRHGVDPIRDRIPVAPAAHYLMGGVRTDSWGQTSLPGLFACGEVACTGVHGANRLASNSLLEGLVFGRRAVQRMVGMERERAASGEGYPSAVSRLPGTAARPTGGETPEAVLRLPSAGEALPLHEGQRRDSRRHVLSREGLAEIMWRHAGLVRSRESLEVASAAVTGSSCNVDEGQAGRELANLRLLAGLVVRSALIREESRGAHFRSDFPVREAAWQRHIVLSRQGVALSPPAVASGAETAGALRDR